MMYARDMVQIDSRHEDSLPGTYFYSGLHFYRSKTCSVLSGDCHLYLARILLMRSGDVETNPGPDSVSQEQLEKIARGFPHNLYTSFSYILGMEYNAAQAILVKHGKDYHLALMEILMAWKTRTGGPYPQLVDALKNSGAGGLVALVEPGYPSRPQGHQTLPVESQIHPLSPELVERCARDFKFKYRSTLCKIKADPLNPASHMGFEKLYTNLVLKEEDGSGKRLLYYSDLLNLKVNGEFPKRIMVQGEAGAGKTTFCAKIAWDWLEGRYFRNHVWVLIVPLCEFQHRTIGQIAKLYLTKDNPATPSQLTHYIRSNQDKVLIALDGLDEFRGKVTPEGRDSSKSECHQSQSADQMQHQSSQSSIDTLQPSTHTSDTCESPSYSSGIELVDIIRSDQLEVCPVLVTTRTWKAAEIRADNELMNLYSIIHVEGFSRENLPDYIHKYFPDNKAKANRLIKFTHENDVVSDHMAHYPIYVAMLCLMWKKCDDQALEKMKLLQTFSQIFKKMLDFLKEHYAQRVIKKAVGKSLRNYLQKISKLLKPIAELALTGLLENNLIFSEDDFKEFQESLDMACKVGLLSQENRITPSGDGDDEDTSHMESAIFFPHKLFQEYMAAVHFASLYESDCNKFNRFMKEVVLPKREEFRYFLCFAVSRNKAIANHVMQCLVQDKYEMERNMDLLVDVAFESQDQDVAALLWGRVSSEKMRLRIHQLTAHTAAGYIFTGIYVYATSLICAHQECGLTMSHDVAKMIYSPPSLSDVTLSGVSFRDDFFEVLAKEGKRSKVQNLHLSDVKCPSPVSSQNLAEVLCSLPNLNHLSLSRMDLSEEFCSTWKAKASTFKVRILHLYEVECPTPASSQKLAEALCSMGNLTDLKLSGIDRSEELCFALKANASTLKAQHLFLAGVSGPTLSSSQNLVEALCFMPNLTSLTLQELNPSKEFCSTLRAKASALQVESVMLWDVKCPTPATSRNLAEALCLLPNMSELVLEPLMGEFRLHEEFYFALNAMASSMQECFPHISKGDFKFNGILQESLDSYLDSFADFQRKYPPIRTSQPSENSQQHHMGDVQLSDLSQQHPTGDAQPSDHSQQQPVDDVQSPDHSQQQPMDDVQSPDHSQQQPMGDVQHHSQQQPIGDVQPSDHSQQQPIGVVQPSDHPQQQPMGDVHCSYQVHPPTRTPQRQDQSHQQTILGTIPQGTKDQFFQSSSGGCSSSSRSQKRQAPCTKTTAPEDTSAIPKKQRVGTLKEYSLGCSLVDYPSSDDSD